MKIFVLPKWLEEILVEKDLPLETALSSEKLLDTLSVDDVAIYIMSQELDRVAAFLRLMDVSGINLPWLLTSYGDAEMSETHRNKVELLNTKLDNEWEAFTASCKSLRDMQNLLGLKPSEPGEEDCVAFELIQVSPDAIAMKPVTVKVAEANGYSMRMVEDACKVIHDNAGFEKLIGSKLLMTYMRQCRL